MTLRDFPGRISPSTRIAVLAFCLSSWFEGYAQVRNSTISASSMFDSRILSLTIILGDGLEQETSEGDDNSEGVFWRWLTRKGRKMSEVESSIMGAMDVVTSLCTLHFLKTGPLFPFLLTPLISAIPLPRDASSLHTSSIKWRKVIITSIMLCLTREMERVLVAQGVKAYSRRKDRIEGVFTGPVIVRGSPLAERPRRALKPSPSSASLSWMYESSDEDEDEPECMICSGRSTARADLSQSMTSVSSHFSNTSQASGEGAGSSAYSFGFIPSGSTSSLGPLETFCTVAPNKHVAHRACILRWHAAYSESQRQRHPNQNGETVDVHIAGPVQLQMAVKLRSKVAKTTIRRTQALLHSTGFDYLSESLRVVWDQVTQSTAGPSALRSSATDSSDIPVPFRPSFTLSPQRHPISPDTMGQPSNSISKTLPPGHLGTLKTSWPPCPGCRSPVELHFCAAPVKRPRSPTGARRNTSYASGTSFIPIALHAMLQKIINWLKSDVANTTDLVTGRTIALSLSGQLSFLITMYSMMRAREHTADFNAAIIAKRVAVTHAKVGST